ncbi:unnamed protein product [Pocillopora meandrina]|uniref:Uncharacterized protein n=1 Tax=Pocillopora meandrina TaxID=46732 RepID=A0AAU9Y4G3_9CNID|nr:unnamed protein product [Pocillopora meandrina]
MLEALCGKEKCTPNMHLHGHFKDCILDYGPVFPFWCFSFERYNGIMGDYHTNNVNIGVQIIFPGGMEEFQQLMDCEGKQKGTLLEAMNVNLSKTETQVPLPPIKRGCN